jgi:MerC mercury resistance protein/thioredoxin family protein
MGKTRESQVEARLASVTERRVLDASQTSLCPACWPAYAGLLTSVGLGFLNSAVYLLPLTIAFLVLALGAMVFRATERHGYQPFLLGMVAAGGVLVGKFVWESSLAIYASVGLLVMASLWNTWPHHDKANQGELAPLAIQKEFSEILKENIMTTKKKIEVFSAGCATCKETIELVKRIAGSSHEVVIHDMHQSDVPSQAKHYGVRSVPQS